MSPFTLTGNLKRPSRSHKHSRAALLECVLQFVHSPSFASMFKLEQSFFFSKYTLEVVLLFLNFQSGRKKKFCGIRLCVSTWCSGHVTCAVVCWYSFQPPFSGEATYSIILLARQHNSCWKTWRTLHSLCSWLGWVTFAQHCDAKHGQSFLPECSSRPAGSPTFRKQVVMSLIWSSRRCYRFLSRRPLRPFTPPPVTFTLFAHRRRLV